MIGMRKLRERLFRVCPESGRIVGVRPPQGAWFPLVGLAALIWFVVRVVPKPSRAAYPCQRVAGPLASTFLVWLLGMAGSALAWGRARQLGRARPAAGLLLGLAAAAGLAGAVLSGGAPAGADYAAHPPNEPIGTARGLQPGRVAWVYLPEITDWAGPGSGERWYEHVDAATADRMLSLALRTYTGRPTDAGAWQALFKWFNGGPGYAAGQKIAVKINLVTAGARSYLADPEYNQRELRGVTLDSVANAPQLVHALIDQLVNKVGVAQADITVGDPTGLYVNHLYNPIHAAFPEVRFLDNRGTLGRTRAEFGTEPLYWSTPAAAGTTQDYLPVQFQDADYLIDFAVLKSHAGGGVSLTAKNWFGALLRCPDGYLRGGNNGGSPPYNGYYDMHDTLPGDGFRSDPAMTELGQYRSLVDVMGHQGLGDKTLLFLVDGLFGGRDWNSVTSLWSMPPFNDDWPSSLFLSMDPVAIDSVGRDFTEQQWPDLVRMYEGVEDFLHEAALANDPPSGTFYDPEQDGTRLASLGVHEHWNNATDKQYTRNLGTGSGIELATPAVYVAGIQMKVQGGGPWQVQAYVRILDLDRRPAAGATVTVRWTLPDGTLVGRQAPTNAQGTAAVSVGSTQSGTYRVCVTQVRKPGWSYAAARNVETCDQVVVP
jgi:hypothetical protein